MSYLTQHQVDDMAAAALVAYEGSGDFAAMYRAAREHARDEYGVHPRASVVRLAVQLAQLRWQGLVIDAKRANSGEQEG